MSSDDMNQNQSLPFGWKIQKMSEVVKWGSGGTPKATEKSYYEGGTIPWLIIGDLNDGIVKKSDKKITELGLRNSSAKIIAPGTLLVAMYGSIGKLGITGIECSTNQAIAYAKELHGVTTEYMYYYMAMMKSKLISMGKGGTQSNISQTVLNSLDVIVPPIPEQNRIVLRIEELFSELDKAVETLQTIKQQLAIYRQAILKAAFKSVSDYKTVSAMSSLVTSGSRGWAKYYSNDGAKFIRIGNLTRTGIDIDLNHIQYVSLPEKTEGTRTRLHANDVLVSITADLGSIGLVPQAIDEAYINQHIALIRFINPNQGKLLAWFLRSEFGQKSLLKNKRGGGKLGLGLDDIRDSQVPNISDAMANDIVSKIESQVSVCEKIEQTVDATLKQVAYLRYGILGQCFGKKN